MICDVQVAIVGLDQKPAFSRLATVRLIEPFSMLSGIALHDVDSAPLTQCGDRIAGHNA